MANELRKAATFLGTPGNTLADYITKMEKENPSAVGLSDEESAELEALRLEFGSDQ